MKKLITAVLLIYGLAITPLYAQTQGKHAIGDMYTKVLNSLESRGHLDTLDPKKYVMITDMHIDHGQVFVTTVEEGAPITSVYDMLGNKIISDEDESH